ncbi:MAG: zf-HC2 domain-containing protein [Alphaproteobacteria bacterium]|nr:zf-HC2 domain-containing protein [Alphaproteobacteria bacterium]
MTQDDGSRSAPDASGRALWRRTKVIGRETAPAASGRPVDDGMIAAWLDGRLSETDAARVERHLVEYPQALQAVLDIRNALADAARAPVPDRVVVRAQALVGFDAERKATRSGLAGLLGTLFGTGRRALEMAAVGAAFMIVIAGGFSLGGGTQEAYARSAQNTEMAVELVFNPLGVLNVPPDLMDLVEQGGR